MINLIRNYTILFYKRHRLPLMTQATARVKINILISSNIIKHLK